MVASGRSIMYKFHVEIIGCSRDIGCFLHGLLIEVILYSKTLVTHHSLNNMYFNFGVFRLP